jgi:hypothetical protein
MRKSVVALILLVAVLVASNLGRHICPARADEPTPSGDVNGDLKTDIADAVYLLNYLFRSGPPPAPALAVPMAVGSRSFRRVTATMRSTPFVPMARTSLA